MRDVDGRPGRLAPALIFLATLTSHALADDSIAETLRKWGLIGAWSLDCALPPDRGKGTVLAYQIAPDGSVLLLRDFGDDSDENKVTAARISSDGILNLEVDFSAIKEKRKFGLIKLRNGTMRAIYNRSEKGQYSIKDGKFTANGRNTPVQYKCR
jgi:hypothetical protein